MQAVLLLPALINKTLATVWVEPKKKMMMERDDGGREKTKDGDRSDIISNIPEKSWA